MLATALLFALIAATSTGMPATAAGATPEVATDLLPDRELLARARHATEQENYAEAIDLYREMLALAPANDSLLHEAARVTSWAGNYDESVAYYDRAVRGMVRDGRGANPLVLEWAQVLGWAGRPADGIALLDDHGLASGEALAVRGDLLRWSGDVTGAAESYRKAVAADPGLDRARDGLESVRETPEYRLLLAEKALRETPEGTRDADARNDAATDYLEALVAASRYYDASRFADSLLAAGVPDPERRIRLAREEARRGSADWLASETERRRERWVARRDSIAEGAALDSVELAYADILVSQGRNREAFDRYRAVVKRSPGDRRPVKRIADLYRWEGRRDWAKRASLRNGLSWHESEPRHVATPVVRHTTDSESFAATGVTIGLAQAPDDARTGDLVYEHVRMSQSGESVAIDRLGAGGRYLWRDGVSVRANWRLNAYDEAGITNELGAGVEYLRGIRWKVEAGVERFDVPERALSLRAVGDDPLHGTSYRSSVAYMPDGPVRAGVTFSRTLLGDGNRATNASWKAQYALRRSPRVAIEYRGSTLSYAEPSDLYWSPDSHLSHKGGVHVSFWGETVSFECEAFLGRSREVRAGTSGDVTASFSYAFSNRARLDTGFFHSRVFRSDGAYELTAVRAGLTVGR